MASTSRPKILKEPLLLELESPITVIGDVHGMFRDVQMIFEQSGHPHAGVQYLFLGDYVDRGPYSVSTVTYLLLYKLLHPTQVYLLRGNHESRIVNKVYGFYVECQRKFKHDEKIYELYNSVFNCLPLCARISKRIFCMHGGISQDLCSWTQFSLIKRPCSIPNFGLPCDLLWADPDPVVSGYKHSPRGVSFVFGENAVREFCAKFDLDLIVRAHQVVADGYEFFASRHLVTIFSTANYCGRFDNAGASLCIDEHLECKIFVRRPTHHRIDAEEPGRQTAQQLSELHKNVRKMHKASLKKLYQVTRMSTVCQEKDEVDGQSDIDSFAPANNVPSTESIAGEGSNAADAKPAPNKDQKEPKDTLQMSEH